MWRKGARYDGINHSKGGLIDRGNTYTFSRSFVSSIVFIRALPRWRDSSGTGRERLRTIEKWVAGCRTMWWSTRSRQLVLPPRSREERAGKETRKKSVIVPYITVLHARERLVSTSATLEIIETNRKRKHPTKESTSWFLVQRVNPCTNSRTKYLGTSLEFQGT